MMAMTEKEIAQARSNTFMTLAEAINELALHLVMNAQTKEVIADLAVLLTKGPTDEDYLASLTEIELRNMSLRIAVEKKIVAFLLSLEISE
jgi:hypothetical protein